MDRPIETSRKFLELVPVVDISFLDAGYVVGLLAAMEYNVEEQYIPWNSGWHDFNNMSVLSKYLKDNAKVPNNTNILLKLYHL